MINQFKNIPGGWEEVMLQDISKKIGDGLHTTPEYSEDKKYYFINGNNLHCGSIVINEKTKSINEDEYQKHKLDLSEDSLLLSINGTIGNVAYYNDEKVVLGKSAAYISCSKSVDKNFIYFFLNSLKARHYFNSELTGSTIRNLSLKSIRNTKLSIPPITEQQRIVKVLETWDLYLAKLVKKIEIKKKIKRGLIQQLLIGKKRLSEFTDKWEAAKLEEVCEIKKGKGLSKKKLTKNGLNKCILYGEIYTTYSEVIKNVVSTTNVSEGLHSKKEDVLIPSSTTTSAIDLAVATTIQEDNILLGGDINVIRPKKNNINGVYFSHYLTHIKKLELARLAQGITIIHLYGKDIKKLAVNLPSFTEQTAIAEILTTADEEIETVEKKKKIVTEQKKFLLNNLITGEIRLPEFRN